MNKTAFLLAVITGFLWYFGVLAKVMHWPGAGAAMTLGGLTGQITLILFLIHRYRNKAQARLATYGMYFLGSILCLAVVTIGLFGPSGSILKHFALLDGLLSNQIHQYDAMLQERNARLRLKMQELEPAQAAKLETLAAKVHMATTPTKGILTALQEKLVFETVQGKDPGARMQARVSRNLDITSIVMIHQGEGRKLRAALAETSQRLEKIVQPAIDAGVPHLHIIPIPLDPIPAPGEPAKSWEMDLFEGQPVAAVLPILTAFELDVRASEVAVLDYLLNLAEHPSQLDAYSQE